MKNLYKLLLISILFIGCYKIVEVDYFYADYSRIAGPEGDTLFFFSNYQNDTGMLSSEFDYLEFDDRMAFDSNHVLLKLEIPSGALDSELVFNFYQYQDYEVANDLSQGFAKLGCKFFYFVPVYYNLGYHEHDEADLSFHESFNFNTPLTVSYYYAKDKQIKTVDEKQLQLEFYDAINPSYKLYRIKIPRVDEWGSQRNIYVDWNSQGYPNGFNKTDLNDIILGYWYLNSDEYEDDLSLVNWEEVTEFELDLREQKVTFNIENADYLYVLANIILIDPIKIPQKIRTFINNNFNEEIKRACFEDGLYRIYLEDNSIVFFTKNGDFDHAEIDNIILPQYIRDYISSNFAGEQIHANELVRSSSYLDLYVSLKNKIVHFTGTNIDSLVYSDYSNFDDETNLPQNIILYINQNFENPQIQNVYTTTFNNFIGGYEVYISYNHKHAKLTFDNSGTLIGTIYYGLKFYEIEDTVFQTLISYFNGVDIASITKEIQNDSSFYSVNLINDAYFKIRNDGELQDAFYYELPQNLPMAVKNKIQTYESRTISNASYSYKKGQNPPENYLIECVEGLYLAISPNGTVSFASSSNFYDLPSNIQNYLTTNYSQDLFADFYYGLFFYINSDRYIYYVYLDDSTVLVFDNFGNFLGTSKNSVELKNKKENFKANFAN